MLEWLQFMLKLGWQIDLIALAILLYVVGVFLFVVGKRALGEMLTAVASLLLAGAAAAFGNYWRMAALIVAAAGIAYFAREQRIKEKEVESNTKTCPKCGRTTHEAAQYCECAYKFGSGNY